MKNARVRFAIDDDGSIYDYQNKRSYAPVGMLEDGDAVWDLAKVKANIEAELFVDEARTPNSPALPDGTETGSGDQNPLAPAPEADKVEAAAETFLSDPALPPVDPTDPVVVADQAGDEAAAEEPKPE